MFSVTLNMASYRRNNVCHSVNRSRYEPSRKLNSRLCVNMSKPFYEPPPVARTWGIRHASKRFLRQNPAELVLRLVGHVAQEQRRTRSPGHPQQASAPCRRRKLQVIGLHSCHSLSSHL